MSSNLEMLMKLLGGEQARAESVKRLEPTIVEDSPLEAKERFIADTAGTIKAPVGKFYMQNLEPRASEAAELADVARSEKKESGLRSEESRAFLKKQLENAPSIKPYESRYSNQIESALAEIEGAGKEKEPIANEKDKKLTQLIQAFGGGALGILAGGESGMRAGAAAGQTGLDMMKQSLAREAELEKIKLQKGEKIHTEKLKALLDMEKRDADRYNKSVELQRDFYKSTLDTAEKLFGKDSDEYKAAMSNLRGYEDKFQDVTMNAVKAVGGAQIEADKMSAAQKRAETMAQVQAQDKESNLRKEFNSLPEIKNFKDVEFGYNKIKESSKDPSAAGDLSIIYGFMKMNDPGSVVRESEFATADQARAAMSRLEESGVSMPSIVVSAIQKLETGQRLLPEQRQDFINQSSSLYRAQALQVNRAKDQYSKIAESYGYDPLRVITVNPLDLKSAKKLPPPETVIGPTARKIKLDRLKEIQKKLGK